MTGFELLQEKIATSAVREQHLKEAAAGELLASVKEARKIGAEVNKEGLIKARLERETAEMVQRAMSEAIAKDRNPTKDWS